MLLPSELEHECDWLQEQEHSWQEQLLHESEDSVVVLRVERSVNDDVEETTTPSFTLKLACLHLDSKPPFKREYDDTLEGPLRASTALLEALYETQESDPFMFPTTNSTLQRAKRKGVMNIRHAKQSERRVSYVMRPITFYQCP